MTLFEHGYALLIGIGTTKDPELSLPVTARDAQAIGNILTDERFCGYPDNPDHVRLLRDVVRTLFGHRRKTLRQNIRKAYRYMDLTDLAGVTRIDLTRRPETLTLQEWRDLARYLSTH